MKASTAWGLNIDLSYNYGNNQLTFDVRNSLNNSLGLSSPTAFYAGGLEITQHVLNADFNKSVDWGHLAYPLNLAFGVEWRGEIFNEYQGEEASYINGGVRSSAGTLLPGAQVFSGFKPSDSGGFDRNSHSMYIDLEGNLTEKFSAGVAGRYEHYSDFSNTRTGKVSLRYAFTPKSRYAPPRPTASVHPLCNSSFSNQSLPTLSQVYLTKSALSALTTRPQSRWVRNH